MKPKVAFFDFTGFEGCQLDALNLNAEDLINLLNAVDIVNFREVMTERADDYDIAFVEGSVTTEGEITRLKKIREAGQNSSCSWGMCLYRWYKLFKEPCSNGRCIESGIWKGCRQL
jgi:coenzyme F420-reducing hydrogenase gamma subunit